jgi:hypothetical protein
MFSDEKLVFWLRKKVAEKKFVTTFKKGIFRGSQEMTFQVIGFFGAGHEKLINL